MIEVPPPPAYIQIAGDRYVEVASIAPPSAIGAITPSGSRVGSLTQVKVANPPRQAAVGLVSAYEVDSQFECDARASRATQIRMFDADGNLLGRLPVTVDFAPMADDEGLHEAFDIACNGMGDRQPINLGLVALISR